MQIQDVLKSFRKTQIVQPILTDKRSPPGWTERGWLLSRTLRPRRSSRSRLPTNNQKTADHSNRDHKRIIASAMTSIQFQLCIYQQRLGGDLLLNMPHTVLDETSSVYLTHQAWKKSMFPMDIKYNDFLQTINISNSTIKISFMKITESIHLLSLILSEFDFYSRWSIYTACTYYSKIDR